MVQNQRKHVRYEDFGRIECEEICPMAGILDDISGSGCKVHYDAPISLNLENDYELHVRLSRYSSELLVLMAHPQWNRENDEGCTEVGFLFLHSPDTARLEKYIQNLNEELNSPAGDIILPQEEDSCQFV